MGDTSIEWTAWPGTRGKVWNPTRGCSRVSPGCGAGKGVGGCYAERQAFRFSQPTERTPHPPYEGLVQLGKQGSRWTGKVPLVVDMLGLPTRWRGRSTVFVNSMSDLFHEALSNEAIAAVFGVMAACQRHTFIVLTKRADRMRRWFEWVEADGASPDHVVSTCASNYIDVDCIAQPWPLPNVVIGVSVENQEWADKRIPHLLATPAACRMVSYEPALGPVDFTNIAIGDDWGVNALVADAYATGYAGTSHILKRHPAIDWLVLGGESGPGARPFDIEWARTTIVACRTVGVPVYVKQLGRRPVDSERLYGVYAPEDLRSIRAGADLGCSVDCPPNLVMLWDRKGADMSKWPDNLQVRELPAISRRHDRSEAAE